MFKIQVRDPETRRWRDMLFGKCYGTESEAWQAVASYDQDGIADRFNNRVVDDRRALRALGLTVAAINFDCGDHG